MSSQLSIPLTIVDRSGSGEPVYLYLFSNETLEYLVDRDGGVVHFPRDQRGGLYGLRLEPGENRLRLPRLPAMRAYVAIGRQFVIDTDADGRPVAVDAGTPGNPNYDLIWDFCEVNWLASRGAGIEQSRLHGDLTQVDAFGLAMRLEFSGLDPADPTREKRFDIGFVGDGARAEIFAELAAAEPWQRLVIRGAHGAPVRALMPGFAIAHGDQVPPDRRFPEDQLQRYIADCLDYYRSRPLSLEYDGADYTCAVEDGRFTFIRDGDGRKYTMLIDGLEPPVTRTGKGTEAVYRNAIVPSPDDGPGRRIAAVLGASLLRSTLMHDPRFPVPRSARDVYYRHAPTFLYARAIHERAIDEHAFCFGYDEVELDAGNGEVINPTSMTLTIQPIAT